MFRVLALCLLVLAAPALRADDLWHIHYSDAQALSRRTGHPMLIAFTGSWNACRQVDDQVFATDEFKEYADKHYVLFRIDLSADPAKLPPGVGEQNEALKAKYGIVNFPSFVVLDPEEHVSKAMTGAPEGGVKGFIDALKAVEGN